MIVIVIGMHRSGTSAVAGILHLNGIAMGSEKNFQTKTVTDKIPKDFTRITILGKSMTKFSSKLATRSNLLIWISQLFMPVTEL